MKQLVIFDGHGHPKLRIVKNGNLITYRNNYVGFIRDNAVYDFNGTQRGWFEGGLLRDLGGNTVGFLRGATGTPRPMDCPRFAVGDGPRTALA